MDTRIPVVAETSVAVAPEHVWVHISQSVETQNFIKAVLSTLKGGLPTNKAEAIKALREINANSIEPVIAAITSALIANLPPKEQASVKVAAALTGSLLSSCGCW